MAQRDAVVAVLAAMQENTAEGMRSYQAIGKPPPPLFEVLLRTQALLARAIDCMLVDVYFVCAEVVLYVLAGLLVLVLLAPSKTEIECYMNCYLGTHFALNLPGLPFVFYAVKLIFSRHVGFS